MMERLTGKWALGGYAAYDPIDILDNDYSKINYHKLVDKLGEYEDLEEQGLLLRLPCKVGNEVYAIYRTCKREDGVEIRCLYNEIEPKCIRECVKVVKGVEFRVSFLDGYFGEAVFLTREEAEARLKELEGEE